MKRVVIESPYAGKTEGETNRNVRYARAALRDCLFRGEAPFASHLLYTQPGVLNDKNPVERACGMDAGLAFIRNCDITVVYEDLGISPGMEQGIQAAKDAGRPIEIRSLEGWRKS